MHGLPVSSSRAPAAAATYTLSLHDALPIFNIGAIRGGIPYRPNRTSPHCAIYVDVRIVPGEDPHDAYIDRKSTRLNSSHVSISYAVFCLKKKNDPDHINVLAQQGQDVDVSS